MRDLDSSAEGFSVVQVQDALNHSCKMILTNTPEEIILRMKDTGQIDMLQHLVFSALSVFIFKETFKKSLAGFLLVVLMVFSLGI